MPDVDMFGVEIPEADDYAAYIGSKKWALKREQKLALAGYKCERCGLSKFSGKLSIHHLTYERLGNERMEDLRALCEHCHPTEDALRRREAYDRSLRPPQPLPPVNGQKYTPEECAVYQIVLRKWHENNPGWWSRYPGWWENKDA